MRIIAADWMGNASQIPGQAMRPKEEGGGVPVRFRTRATAPTTAQVIQPTRTQHIVDDVIIVPLSTLRSMYLKGCVCRTCEICASPDLMPSRGLL